MITLIRSKWRALMFDTDDDDGDGDNNDDVKDDNSDDVEDDNNDGIQCSTRIIRSQCTIHIRWAINDTEKDVPIWSLVLTIADRAIFDRMIKAGNEGARFADRAFKNKTSMVLLFREQAQAPSGLIQHIQKV